MREKIVFWSSGYDKEKIDGRIKRIIYSNGIKQKQYFNYGEDMSSPTVSLEGLIITLVSDSYE